MKTYRLKIELQSDLCPGSGYDYAGVIDSDVCADEYGLPYIPARRLKGCFRETAEKILCLPKKEIDELFGVRGDDGRKGFIIRNAYLQNYEELRAALQGMKYQNSAHASNSEDPDRQNSLYAPNPERVLEQFTSVRAQTKLDHGVAQQETLRYTRVIDCRNNVTDGNVTFVSEVLLDEESRDTNGSDGDSGAHGGTDLYRTLKQIVKATKNIGLQRNRGLGSVRCTLTFPPSDPGTANEKRPEETSYFTDEETKSLGGGEENRGDGSREEDSKEEQLYELRFTVENIDPLQISADSDDHSLTYINGASVRGCLAANYWRMYKNTSAGGKRSLADETNEFERIFLSETIFNNLYPSENGQAGDPAPLYLRRLKKTKALVNIVADDEREQDKDAGNRPQKIKNAYILVRLEDEKGPGRENGEDIDRGNIEHTNQRNRNYIYRQIETEMALQNHHRTDNDPSAEALLYTLETISPGQSFTGTILTPYKNVTLMKKLLEQGHLSFGKSKSAQYGRCVLKGTGTCSKYAPETVSDSKNRFLVSLVSNAQIRGQNGEYTTKREEVTAAILSALAGEISRREKCQPSTAGREPGRPAHGIELLPDFDVNVLPAPDSTETIPQKNRVFTRLIETQIVYGYNTMWNLKRTPVPTVAAGSSIVVTVPHGVSVPSEFYAGENRQEGFGHVRVLPYSGMKYQCTESDGSNADSGKRSGASDRDNTDARMIPEAGRKLLQELAVRELHEELLQNAFTETRINVDSSPLGRVILMLRESYRVSGESDKEFLKEFSTRCKSIKTESVKSGAVRFVEQSEKTFGAIVENNKEKLVQELSDKQRKELLYRFMLTALTAEKYSLKNSGKDGE